MPDTKFTGNDGYINEVLMPVIENYLKTNSALIQLGLATDAGADVDYARGGRHVTRVEFRGKLEAERLRVARTKQKVTYEGVRYPMVSSITTLQFEGEAVDDIFDDAGFLNRVQRHMQEVALEDLDRTLMDCTMDIGDGSINYGAVGTSLVKDLTGESVKTINYTDLVKVRGLFGDYQGALVALLHSRTMTDLLLTTEAKNVQQGVVLGNVNAVLFPSLNMFAVQTDRVPTSGTGASTQYTNLICQPGCMSYAWKKPLSLIPDYQGEYVWDLDWIWRYAILRNVDRGKPKVARLVSLSDQSAE